MFCVFILDLLKMGEFWLFESLSTLFFPQIVSHVNVNHLTSRCTDGGRTQVLGTIYDLICLEPFH